MLAACGFRQALADLIEARAQHSSQRTEIERLQKWEGDFLARGSAETPGHNHHDFRFKDYAPLVFRQIRERFGIEAPDYMLSLTHHSRLKSFRPFPS